MTEVHLRCRQTVEQLYEEVAPVIFDPKVMPKRVNQAAGEDLVIIICHGWEIGTLAVQILHDGLSHLGRLQCVLVEVLSLPVSKAFFDHLCHSLIVVLVKGDEQVGFILELIRVIPLRAEEAEGVVVNIGRIVGAVALSVVIACKGTALLIEQHREQIGRASCRERV